MTPESVLEDAAEALHTAAQRGLYNGHLCFWEGKLQALPRTHTTKPHPIFEYFGPTILWDGHTSKEWNALKLKLWNFFKERI